MEHLKQALLIVDSDLQGSKDLLQKAASEQGMTFETIGALGRRTIHQQKPTCQLVLQVSVHQTPGQSSDDNLSHFSQTQSPTIIPLESPDGLLDFCEIPNFDQSSPSCNPLQQAILLAQISLSTREESIHDVAFREQLRPFWQFIIQQPQCNPVVLFAALWHRSLLESFEEKRAQRSALQILQLLPLYSAIKSDRMAQFVELPSLKEMQKYAADLCFQTGLFSQALDLWRQLKDWSRFLQTFHTLGLDLRSEVQTLLSNEPHNAEALYWKGFLDQDLEAIELCWKTSAQPKALSLMAKILFQAQRFDEALARVQEALALKPHTSSDWYVLGMCQSELKDWKSAICSYQRLVALEPENSRAWQLLGNLQMQQGLSKEGVQSLKCAHLLCQPSSEQWKAFGEMCKGVGEESEAEFALRKAQEAQRER